MNEVEHRMVDLNIGGKTKKIDEGIADFVEHLNLIGVITLGSCQGNGYRSNELKDQAWVQVASFYDVMIALQEIKKDGRCIFVYHPHYVPAVNPIAITYKGFNNKFDYITHNIPCVELDKNSIYEYMEIKYNGEKLNVVSKDLEKIIDYLHYNKNILFNFFKIKGESCISIVKDSDKDFYESFGSENIISSYQITGIFKNDTFIIEDI